MEILYCKNYPDGYNKISAIKQDGTHWNNDELDTNIFGILKIEVSEEIIKDWAILNQYCVNESEDGIEETPAEYLFKITEEINMPKIEEK